MPIKYEHHGGSHYVAVVHCPNICRDRLVHLCQDGRESWVIRDYITGQQLRRSPHPNPSSSNLDLAQIEAEVVWSEEAPFHPWDDRTRWEGYLHLRTKGILGKTPPGTTPPNPAFGNWAQL